jgi:oligopeptide/dipeptide ABC transporter ATP-binding protein
VVASLCDRVFVMYGGRTIERGPRQQILSQPGHPYTQALVMAARSVRREDGTFVTLTGDAVPGVTDAGCGFATRCRQATSACNAGVPGFRAVAALESHHARCILHRELSTEAV